MAAAISFLALGILLSWTCYWVRNDNKDTSLQNTLETLKQHNRQLQDTQEKMQIAAEELEKRHEQIQETNTQLHQNIASLNLTTEHLRTENGNITASHQQLTEQLHQLEQLNRNLSDGADKVQRAVPLIKAQVARFTKENLSLGRELNVLSVESIGLNRETQRLAATKDGVDRIFDKGIQELSEQIDRANALPSSLFTSFKEQNQALDQELNALIKTNGELKQTEEAVTRRNGELRDLDKSLMQKTSDLKSIERQLSQMLHQFDSAKRGLEAANCKTRNLQEEYSQLEYKVDNAKNELLCLNEKLKDEEVQLRTDIERLKQDQQHHLLEVQKKIDEKIAEFEQKKQGTSELDRRREVQEINIQIENN